MWPPRRLCALLAFVLFAFLTARTARAETLEAPVGGKALALGARVACGPVPGGWGVENGGHAVRPPGAQAAVGTSVELKLAASTPECAKATETAKLVATGAWPAIDAGAFVLALDEGRLEGKGKGLVGVSITWPVENGYASDTCREPKSEGGVEACAWGVPKSLPADPSASVLRWLPAGAVWSADATLFNADGKRVAPESFVVTPGRVDITQLLPGDTSVDVSSGVGVLPLSHPGAVARVECTGATCGIENGAINVQAPPASVAAIEMKFRLATHVFYTRKAPPDPQPTLRVSVLRCPMTVASGPALRGVDGARIIVRVEGGCTRDAGNLRYLIGSRRAEIVQTVTVKDAAYVVLALGRADAPNLSVTAVRGDTDATVVAVARTDTRPLPPVRTVLEIPRYPHVEFIPNNRDAIVHPPHVSGGAFVVLPVEGVYAVKTENGVTTVRGDPDAAGQVSLQLSYRAIDLPPPLDKVDLALVTDPLQRPIKEANIPAPFDTADKTPAPLVELVCSDEAHHDVRINPGNTVHLPFSVRDNCRVIFHRERLSPELGTQKVTLEVDVNKLDGSPRPEAHLSQTLVLRGGGEPRVAWLKGISSPYDRATIKLSFVADETHYLGALEIVSGAPAAQWTLIFGTGTVRIYVTSAIPTGLYRFGDKATSGVLSLSFGVIPRLTWVDSDGHEGLLGLEAGAVAFALTGDSGPNGQSLTQFGAVVGLGLSIPIVNAGAPTQASINLHGWYEQRLAGSAGNPRAFIFGPSFSFGNLGATF